MSDPTSPHTDEGPRPADAPQRPHSGVSVDFVPRPTPAAPAAANGNGNGWADQDEPDEIVPAPRQPDDAETNPGAPTITPRRGLFGRGKPADRQAKTPTAKKPKPLSPAARKRALDAQRRKMRLGTRYGGDRWKRVVLESVLVGAVLLSIISLIVAVQKPSRDEIAAEVTAQVASSGLNFPSGEAVMWAGQVLRVWGTWDEKSADSRAVLLAPYLSQGMDAQAGWNERGKQEVIYSSLDPQPKTIDSSHAIVVGAYQRSDLTWSCVALPIFAFHPKEFSANAPWAFALSGNPVPTACNPRTGAVPLPGPGADMKTDPDLGRDLAASFFPGFFSAWAASDANALTQYTSSGVTTMGLGGAMASVPPPSVGEVTVLVDADGAVEGKVYEALVPVSWTVANTTSKVSATYAVPIIKRGDRWYVNGEPTAAPQAPGVNGGQPGALPEPGAGVTPDPKTYPKQNTTPPPAAPATADTNAGATPAPTKTGGS